MVTLRRTVRFAINPVESDHRNDCNGHAGRPSLEGWGSHYEFSVGCRGEPDPSTGYLINIKAIDDAVRQSVIPLVRTAMHRGVEPSLVMPELFAAACGSIPVDVESVTLGLTPTYTLEMEAGMGATIVLSQKFEFAAAHRLHAPTMSADENRRYFGKCNNPAGHGHNYVIAPRVEMRPAEPGGSLSLAEYEQAVQRVLIEPFDHKHLNLDTREFADGAGVNPTVENIAAVFFRLLAPAIDALGKGARLRDITVWETDRTSATYGESPDRSDRL